jgi:eukaryotic translation initiation factor 2C
MIKFAVTLPKERWEAVERGVKMLNWEQDQYLQNFGLKISSKPAVVKGRVLSAPEPTFAV